VGLGGSATNDGGVGAARALALEFWNETGQPIHYAQDFASISRVSLTDRFFMISQHQFVFLSDVQNPLCGPNGASHVFGPQKGATPEQVEALDRGLALLADVIQENTGRDFRFEPGLGAAGGFALPFMAYFHARIISGIDYVLDLANFDQKLVGTDLVISGEGRTDAQSAMGKVISALARRCKVASVPLVLLSGSVTADAESLKELGVSEMIAITPQGTPLDQAMLEAEVNLRLTARQFFNDYARKSRL
jgi:glycerate kinase